MNEFFAHLTLSSITTFLAIYQSVLLSPLLVTFRNLSGSLLVLVPGSDFLGVHPRPPLVFWSSLHFEALMVPP